MNAVNKVLLFFFNKGYQEAKIIPVGARNIIVAEVGSEESAENNYLALRNNKGEYYLNGNWYIQWSGDYQIAGTTIHYARKGNVESFNAPGPLKEPLTIMVRKMYLFCFIKLLYREKLCMFGRGKKERNKKKKVFDINEIQNLSILRELWSYL